MLPRVPVNIFGDTRSEFPGEDRNILVDPAIKSREDLQGDSHRLWNPEIVFQKIVGVVFGNIRRGGVMDLCLVDSSPVKRIKDLQMLKG